MAWRWPRGIRTHPFGSKPISPNGYRNIVVKYTAWWTVTKLPMRETQPAARSRNVPSPLPRSPSCVPSRVPATPNAESFKNYVWRLVPSSTFSGGGRISSRLDWFPPVPAHSFGSTKKIVTWAEVTMTLQAAELLKKREGGRSLKILCSLSPGNWARTKPEFSWVSVENFFFCTADQTSHFSVTCFI